MAKICLSDDGFWKRKKCNDECAYYETCIYRTNKVKAQEKTAELKEAAKNLKESNRHDIGELQIMQGYSLERKIQLSCERIKAWYDWWDGQVYISFSGGKDSTVLLDLVRNVCGYDDVPAVFVDTGLEYPEIREFVRKFDNVTWLKPKMTFKQVLKNYGYPFFSKETSEAIFYTRKYLTELRVKESSLASKLNGAPFIADMLGIERREVKKNPIYQELIKGNIPSDVILDENAPIRVKQLFGKMEYKNNGVFSGEYSKRYDKSRFRFMINAPFEVSNRCCSIMKKAPIKEYNKISKRYAMTGQQASESKLRTSNWVKNGCNGFYMERPISNPMAFWTEQDILLYIKKNNLKICSVYGDIVEDLSGTDEVAGQMTISDLKGFEDMELFDAEKPPLKTTGCNRTGCIFCGFGCHLEKEGDGRFERLRETHPKQYEYIMKPVEEGGLGYKSIIDWINENGNFNIKY